MCIGSGYRALLDPSDHILSTFEFDVLIGADGKRNTVPGQLIRSAFLLVIVLEYIFAIRFSSRRNARKVGHWNHS